MSKPIVSVIVPVYNTENFLDQCLNSIANQTLDDIEIIVINDGSTDSSAEMIQNFSEVDSRYLTMHKRNEGYGATCNRGIQIAKGEWVAIVESDDWIDENMYFDMVNFACESEMQFGKKVDIVKTPWFDVKGWGKKPYEVKSYLYSRLKTDLEPTDITQKTVLLEKHPSIWSAIYRRSFLLENYICFPEYPGSGWADNPFLIDTLTSANSIVYLNKPYYHYRVDLPGTTCNHETNAQVALPFERWCGMTEQLIKKGVSDVRVWQAHYKRGFDYIHGAIVDDGWDNEIVRAGTRRVFDMMNPNLVFDLDTFHPELKALYAKMEGIDEHLPKLSADQVKFYLTETGKFFKQRGLKGTAKLATRELGRVRRSL